MTANTEYLRFTKHGFRLVKPVYHHKTQPHPHCIEEYKDGMTKSDVEYKLKQSYHWAYVSTAFAVSTYVFTK